MRTLKLTSWKSLFLVILSVMLLNGVFSVSAEAAMKKSKAIALYNKTITKWGSSGKKFKVTSSLHNDKSGISCAKKGKKASTAVLYDGQPRFIFKNLGGDSTVEALFYSEENQNIYVFTIKNKKVKCLGVICCDCYGTSFSTPQIYYNSSKKTFSIVSWPHVRTKVQKVYKISSGKLKCVSTVSSYTAPSNYDGSKNIKYYVNNKKKSYSAHKKAWNKYMKKAKRVYWGP